MDEGDQPRWTEDDWAGVRARIDMPEHTNRSEGAES